MGKIGIYGSSFDPVTNVHLWTASTVAHRCKLDKVIFLPCSSKRRDKQLHVEDQHRWRMLELAIDNNPKFVADDYEMKQEAWNIYTYNTLNHFKEVFPEDDIYFIMGADLLVDIGKGKWTKGEELISENKFIVMARNGIDMLQAISHSPILRNNDDGTTFHLLDKGLAMEISSTYIREELAMGGEPRYLLPDSCYSYIKENRLYE
ncbi:MULTISPECIES: nicotinate (nicotinamide) nucleotide adenylyltransferase [Bacillaceae]|uniref:nicotinate (nicotinamide) nucleotide adenylyltransferase n=1 Tax=Bacillaceae TaxID=186817 RepID=UPI001E3789A4|nr:MULTISPECIES: nicotinate (nicotinamide) nucleotide adenylyltransferase [Bacillaceae]MCE4051355.1 nicotinate (nicotinamide) nucleotide adenylyltransferase [Bacillus sp. Au-Bac7]MCM3029256.1 nicotinate (nicotinamide) nucleotide adenylyltransferase [Niallia sp. MER 6]MDL0436433.1 nicotinate (nicotinamide) nucleotide adenylyltransferase [Niallia sp. SS-2023]UPO88671.1 nicotinate (nicotinamide) nucleotide adenylyltransferase [Niallia sp. Man26]